MLYSPLMKLILSVIAAGIAFTSFSYHQKDDNPLSSKIVAHKALVAFWDFGQQTENTWIAKGKEPFKLVAPGEPVKQVEEGPVSGFSIDLDGETDYLSIAHETSGSLDIRSNEVTVVAWVKWEGSGNGFVAGKWNEYDDGGKRQYGLFVSLPHYDGRDQVCGHISKMGGATDPFPYSIDYSASKQTVPKNRWVCVAFTYDGTYIKSYFNGVFEPREPQLISNTAGFLKDKPDGLIHAKNPYYYPYGMGNNGSDFTVGAVQLRRGMGNFFKGKIGGIAVFDKALTDDEMRIIAIMP